MAGKRQHTIPRFLLKGFASRKSGDDVFVWMHRKDGKVIEVNIKNVSVGKDFYGKDADEEITKIESAFGALMHELRAYAKSSALNDARVPRLIAHLSVRTRQLRQTIIEATDVMLRELRAHLTQEETLQALRVKLKRELIASGIPAKRTEAITLGLVKQYLAASAENVISTVQGQFPNKMRRALNEALSKDPIAEPRADSYAQFNWYIVITRSPVMLGDTTCVFEIRGTRRFKPLNDKKDNVKQIFLPVGSDRILVGTRGDCPELDEDLLNKAFVQCSHEFFVCGARELANSPFLSSIGEWSGLLSDDEVRKIVDDVKLEWPKQMDS